MMCYEYALQVLYLEHVLMRNKKNIGLDKSGYQVNSFLIFPLKCVVGRH